MNKDREN